MEDACIDSVDHTNTIAFVEDSKFPLAVVAETEPPEPPKRDKGDRASVVGLRQQLGPLAERQAARIAVKTKSKILFMEMADIMTVHAEGNYASLKYRSSSYFVREPLCSVAVKLKLYGFVQIRRAVLVNISLVDEIQPLRTGEYRLRMKGGTEYVVTRKYKENLRYLAHLWFGSERVFSSAPSGTI